GRHQEIPAQLQQRARKEHYPGNDAGEGREDAVAEFRAADKFHVRSVQESTKAEPCLQNCLNTARQIDKTMTCTPLAPRQYALVGGEDRTEYPRKRV
ncbi:MAG TPA: hypothetical protein VJ255_23545, partial [Candidatus Acidoferrum sp.]|nr:hypothetical protein [Candidatus Acidoferrum sp.]